MVDIVRTAIRQDFQILANSTARDRRLTYRATGLLVELLSRPPGWSVTSDSLTANAVEGRDAIRTALKELEDHGYIHRCQVQDERGRWSHRCYVYDVPYDPSSGPPEGGAWSPGQPASAAPGPGSPAPGNRMAGARASSVAEPATTAPVAGNPDQLALAGLPASAGYQAPVDQAPVVKARVDQALSKKNGKRRTNPKNLLVGGAPHAPTRPDVEQLCTALVEAMVLNGCRRPTVTGAWRQQARLLLDADRRPLDEALDLIRWACADAFWAANCQSIPTLRKQYDRLRLRRKPLRSVPYRDASAAQYQDVGAL